MKIFLETMNFFLEISKDDNVIGLRLGPRRRRGGIIGEESQKGWYQEKY
jgi:hypothetical protein